MTAVVLTLLIGLRGIDLWTRRRLILEAGDRRAENLALILAGYVRETFAATDAALRQIAIHSARIGGPSAPDAEWLPALQAARAAITGIAALTVLDTSGIIRHSTQPAIIGQSRRDQYVFTRLASDTTERLVADLPFRTVAGFRGFIIPIGRRLSTKSGAFDGAAVASFLPDSLRSFFRNVDVGREGSVSAFHHAGEVLFREPSVGNPIGQLATGSPLFEAARRIGGTGHFRGRIEPDAPILRTAFRTLDDQRIIVAVSLSERELLAAWHHDVQMSIAGGALVTLAAIVLVALLYRQMDIRDSAEQALIRSQRLESLGQLTGGVAHDFNNLLTVILGNVSLIRSSGSASALTQDESLAEVERAARRGADLTKQLLAFARRQPLMPRVVDLATAVSSAEAMLRRVVGDTVTMKVVSRDSPCLANVDPVQIETALLNLCINARDAMPNGGSLVIETGRTTLDRDYVRASEDVTPGPYALIAVSDTGAGILPEHLPRVFEPFFTTKAPGKGTGLGLSMVFGFVKQSSGHVRVYSEAGQGTSVKMYFPEAAGTPALATPVPDDDPRGSGEVILLVEDDTLVRATGVRLLRRLGYTVLEAKDGAAALALVQPGTRVDLLLTDVMLPGQLSGPRLAEEIVRRRADIRVLFASGYSQEMIELGARSGASLNFVAKPFDRRKLAQAVRDALRAREPVVAR